MAQAITRILLAALAATAFMACSKKQESPPTPPAPAKTEAAPAPAAQEPAAAPAAPADGFAGEWKGDSGADLPISFSIEGNQVTSLNASYSGKNGSCSYSGSISSDGPAPIANKSFTTKGRSSREDIEFSATGTLVSSSEASGTLAWKGKSSLCGDIDLQYKWTAKKETAAPEDSI